MSAKEDQECKPAISLLLADGASKQQAVARLMQAVAAGMEEEAVPWLELIQETVSAEELAVQGARRSQLGVGIGIGADLAMAVCFNRGDNPVPLFYTSGKESCAATARLMGTNAARLVKKVPFRDMALNDSAGRDGYR